MVNGTLIVASDAHVLVRGMGNGAIIGREGQIAMTEMINPRR